jgi:hypothetical protein
VRIKYHILLSVLVLSTLLWLSLNLNLTYEIEKSIPVKVNVNKPFAIANTLPLNLDAKIKGRGWTLLRLFTSFSVDFNYEIKPSGSDQIVILTKAYLNDVILSGQNLTVTFVKPESLFVKIGKHEEKYVKILSRVNVICKAGYQTVGKPEINPDSILIGGAYNIIGPLKYIYTESKTYNNVNSSISDVLGISDSLSNVIWRSNEKVGIKIEVELTAEKEFRGVEVKVPNIPEDREVLLIPQMISLQVKGGVNQLANLDNSRIRAVVDFNELLSDTTGSVAPSFSLPEGMAVLSASPERIQYVIKKKSKI